MMRGLRGRLGAWARRLQSNVIVAWVVARSRRTPLAARLVAGAVAAYALSPIDLIPDFIPVLGLVDDLLLVPLGIALALRLIPPPLLEAFRAEAEARPAPPRSVAAAVVIVLLWLLAAAALGWRFTG